MLQKDTITNTLSKCRLFSDLDTFSLNIIQSSLKVERFNLKDIIIKEGTPGDKLYIVLKGKVEIVQDFIFNINRVLKIFSSGEYFGEIALISDSNIRSASARALEEDTTCLTLTKSEFYRILEKNPKIAVQIIKTLYERDQQNISKLKADLQNSFHSIINAIGVMAEFRDPETGSHLKRTSFFTKELGKLLMGSPGFEIIDENFVEIIGLSSPLHDIGKVGIPDGILLKPGKLNKEEFEVMKRHSEYGGMVLEKTIKFFSYPVFLDMGLNIATYHHERWDGTGYPRGIEGEHIPVEARIMALCDVYDALRSERPYKKPFTRAFSKEIIVAEKGKQFDPRIVDAFLKAEPSFGSRYDLISMPDYDSPK